MNAAVFPGAFLLLISSLGCGEGSRPDPNDGGLGDVSMFACQSYADCPDPAARYCIAVREEGEDPGVCRDLPVSLCVPEPKGCVCMVGATPLGSSIPPGEISTFCFD